MAGKNLAKVGTYDSVIAMESYKQKIKKPCIFLSHISVDKKTVRKIAKYLKKNADVNIYLDEDDEELQTAVENDDPHKITKFIEKGLLLSTHIMCLVSKDTSSSWWVPYEIGFAKNAGVEISTLKLIENTYLPDFLKITKKIKGIKSLNKYLEDIHNSTEYAKYLLNESLVPYDDTHPLDKYLNWEK